MAGLFRGRNIGGAETETVAPVVPSSDSTRKRRVEAHQFRFVSEGVLDLPLEKRRKEEKIEVVAPAPFFPSKELRDAAETPKFGMTSVCGRRRDMEDAVAIHPSFFQAKNESYSSDLHFFGVYDGHGCSHVAARCKNRMHEIVGEELLTVPSESSPWTEVMKKSFNRMDTEITNWSTSSGASTTACRCELRPPLCDAVGSTAVVAVVTPDKIVVSNSGDSRAVLCRNGKAIALSVDHKPDRPDEMKRIQEAGGRIIYWDGPRVQGFLAMSRAIGDSYLKPYVISDPEVTVTNRAEADECLILASDGLWDAVSNETACSIVRMCLRTRRAPPSSVVAPGGGEESSSSDKGCADASVLLTKLALARGSCDNTSVVVVDLRRNL